MSTLQHQHILLAVTGGIAAYKALELARLLVQAGAKVTPLLTKAAQKFVTPLSLQTLSGSAVLSDLFADAEELEIGHIRIARSADLVLTAPATAQALSRAALGLATDYLGTLYLATRAPLIFAPAMNQAMWLHPATQDHLATLKQRGAIIWGPEEGNLACGEEGPGRLLAPAEILRRLEAYFTARSSLKGIRCLITAGPTQEPIDAVRYISNHSSGKMGYALAEALSEAGAEVILLHGPTSAPPPEGVTRYLTPSALEMLAQAKRLAPRCQVIIGAAAVADFSVKNAAAGKLKKINLTHLELRPNPDIIAELGQAKQKGQLVIGFAAETERLIEEATRKRKEKNLDWVVANQVNQVGGVFGAEENQITLVQAHGAEEWPRFNKKELARRLVKRIANHIQAKQKGEA